MIHTVSKLAQKCVAEVERCAQKITVVSQNHHKVISMIEGLEKFGGLLKRGSWIEFMVNELRNDLGIEH